MKTRILFPFAFALLIACSSRESHDASLKKDLIGEWRNTFLKLTINSIGNSDSTVEREADSTSWELVTHIKPIRTYFSEDGSYRSEYYTLHDSLFRITSGTWDITHDTLTMNQVAPENSVSKLKVTVNKSVAEFNGMIDFDEDGKTDDHYIGKQKRQISDH